MLTFWAAGALYGTYEAFRYKVPGIYKVRYIGQTTLSSAAVSFVVGSSPGHQWHLLKPQGTEYQLSVAGVWIIPRGRIFATLRKARLDLSKADLALCSC